MSKKQTERVAPQDEKYVMKGEIKGDNRGREVFEVKKHGVTIDFTSNITEALSAQRQSMGSVIYSINPNTGTKTLRA